jgi:hypothetical protein
VIVPSPEIACDAFVRIFKKTYECSGPPANFVDLISGATDVNYALGEAAMRGVEVLDAAYRSSVSGREEDV